MLDPARLVDLEDVALIIHQSHGDRGGGLGNGLPLKLEPQNLTGDVDADYPRSKGLCVHNGTDRSGIGIVYRYIDLVG